MGEHYGDIQGFPPCKTTPNHLSFWEESEINKQIQALVAFNKMHPNISNYAYKGMLLIKKAESTHFCGDYWPLNLQSRKDAFPMPLIDDILI